MSAKKPPSQLARTVKRLREERGWSQRQLVEMSGVTSIPLLEAGTNAGLHGDSLVKLSKVFGVPLEALSGRGGVVSPVLADFLERKAPKDITDAEIRFLCDLPLEGRRPTAETYSLALLMLRSTEEAPPVGDD